jgi:hypothetical protein
MHNSLPLLPTPNHINIIHSFTSCFFKVNFNIILTYMLRFLSGFLHSDFTLERLCTFLPESPSSLVFFVVDVDL